MAFRVVATLSPPSVARWCFFPSAHGPGVLFSGRAKVVVVCFFLGMCVGWVFFPRHAPVAHFFVWHTPVRENSQAERGGGDKCVCTGACLSRTPASSEARFVMVHGPVVGDCCFRGKYTYTQQAQERNKLIKKMMQRSHLI